MILNGRGPAERTKWEGRKVLLDIEGAWHDVRSIDISASGALVISDSNFVGVRTGDFCRLVALDDNDEEEFFADCRIARIGSDPAGEGTTIGLAFEAIELSATDHLLETGKIRKDLTWEDVCEDDDLP